MMADPSEVALTQMYSEELDRATAEALDLDMAFRMQMEEALADSVGEPLSDQYTQSQSPRFPSVDLNFEDTAIAYQLQRAEVDKTHQSLENQYAAKGILEEMQEEYKIRAHDGNFAKRFSLVSDEEWERDGDLMESSISGHLQVDTAPIHCVMHFDGASRGNPGHGGAGVTFTNF